MKFVTLLVLPAFVWGSNAASVPDLFETKSSGPGTCSSTDAPIVESWLQDTIKLVDFALQGMNAYQTDTSIRRNLAAFFSIRQTKAGAVNANDRSKFNTVQTTLQNVQDFLNKRNPLWLPGGQPGDGTGKPWLFCNSDWQIETDDLFDDNGNAVPDPQDNTKQASLRTYPATTGDSVTDQMLTDLKLGTSPNWAKFAYYSPDVKDYVVEDAKNRYPGNPPATPRSWCNGKLATPAEDRFALTESRQKRDTVTLCPDAFTTDSEPFETIDAAMADAASKTLSNSLDSASPRSLTLFHELIHMTTGPDATPDVATKPTECLANTLKGADSVKNPDSYVFMAWSYYLTKNGVPPFEWQTGFAANVQP